MIQKIHKIILPLPAPLRDATLIAATPPLGPGGREEKAARTAAAESAREALLVNEGAARERERLAPLERAISDAAREFTVQAASFESAARAQVIELAKAIATEVIRREIEDSRYDLGNIVDECFSIARGVEKGVAICLNPKDYDSALQSGLFKSHESPVCILKADPAIAPGACRVETPYGDVARDMNSAVADVFAAVHGRR